MVRWNNKVGRRVNRDSPNCSAWRRDFPTSPLTLHGFPTPLLTWYVFLTSLFARYNFSIFSNLRSRYFWQVLEAPTCSDVAISNVPAHPCHINWRVSPLASSPTNPFTSRSISFSLILSRSPSFYLVLSHSILFHLVPSHSIDSNYTLIFLHPPLWFVKPGQRTRPPILLLQS